MRELVRRSSSIVIPLLRSPSNFVLDFNSIDDSWSLFVRCAIVDGILSLYFDLSFGMVT